jgi:TniQ
LTDRLPFAPIYRAGEAPTAYAARIAAAYGLDVREFCSDRGIRLRDLAKGEAPALARLARAGGADLDEMARSTFFRTDAYGYEYRGQDVRRGDLTTGRLDVCARCLLDDIDDAGGPSSTDGCFLRADWCLDVVDTCPVHACALVTLHGAPGPAYLFEFSALVAAASGRLQEMSRSSEARAPTALQDYVLARLEGDGTGVPFLDGMGLAAAVRTCEVLGAAACFGGAAQLESLDRPQLRAARIRGFEVAGRGDEGVRELLASMTASYAHGNPSEEGRTARKAFDALHQFLHVNPKRLHWKVAAFARLRAVVRDFIKANFPLQAGETVLGEVIEERRLHSVASLAIEVRIGVPRLRKILQLKGVIDDVQCRLADSNIIFDAKAGFEAVRESIEALSRDEAAKYLGTGRHQVDMFTEAKLIEPIASGPLGLRAAFARAALDTFVASLLAHAVTVKRREPHCVSVSQASRRAVCTHAEIATLILDGRLKWVGNLGGKGDYRSVLVDLAEVDALVHGLDPDTMSAAEFARRLGIKPEVSRALVKHGYVKAVFHQRAGRRVARISSAEVEAFQKRYITLGELRSDLGKHHRAIAKALSEKGIAPAFDLGKGRSLFYERSLL